MLFDLTVRLDKIRHLENGNEILSIFEITIFREEFIKEYEIDSVNLCNTLRHLMYIHYHPFGIHWINGDDAFYTMYEMFCRRKEVLSVTVEIKQTEFVNEDLYGRNKKYVDCGFRLNLKDSTQHSIIE